ncbi:hypothetical protein PFNF54_00895 [Plasmodium falciparum NF54]|uniref:Uncharacterized protein n=1 Tax=Plasmodium falciparum (isolate NF54) TaxID=5843 RepID=W7JYY8_PLAFO|nr:hypothetical protein PFNF54_00895 [Plasmodium falciparum NF54]
MICFFSHFDKKYKFRFYMKQCIFIYVPILTKNNILFGNINDIKIKFLFCFVLFYVKKVEWSKCIKN